MYSHTQIVCSPSQQVATRAELDGVNTTACFVLRGHRLQMWGLHGFFCEDATGMHVLLDGTGQSCAANDDPRQGWEVSPERAAARTLLATFNPSQHVSGREHWMVVVAPDNLMAGEECVLLFNKRQSDALRVCAAVQEAPERCAQGRNVSMWVGVQSVCAAVSACVMHSGARFKQPAIVFAGRASGQQLSKYQ
eukprot:1158714-Pelagomonas_calceolata.AAC.12